MSFLLLNKDRGQIHLALIDPSVDPLEYAHILHDLHDPEVSKEGAPVVEPHESLLHVRVIVCY